MTVREISSITNIPFSTVYRALKNPSTAKLEVLQKINTVLSSEPNIFNLKQVYVIIPFANEFYTKFLIHVITLLSKKGCVVVPFIYHEDQQLEREFLLSLTLSPRVGLIWIPTGKQSDYPFLSRKKNKIPIVSLVRKIDDYSMDVQIFQDNKQAIDISLKYFLSQGKTKVLMVNGYSSLTTAMLRTQYFNELLPNYPNITGIVIEADFQDWKSTYRALIQQTRDLQQFDAIIATSENLCYGVLRALEDQQICKKNISIISFDYTGGLESSGVSMIYFSPEQIAEKTIEALFKKVKDSSYKMNYTMAPVIYYNTHQMVPE